jgi:hypothetical protein
MKRRGFLASLTGAALVGPAAAKQAAQVVGSAQIGSPAPPLHPYPDRAMNAVGMLGGGFDYKKNLLEQVADLERKVAGKRTEEEIEEERLFNHHAAAKFESETRALKSVSAVAKASRSARFHREFSAKQRRFSAKRELANVLKELAGLE